MRQSEPTKESGIYSVEQLRRMANEVVSEPGEWHEYTEAFARAFLALVAERDALREKARGVQNACSSPAYDEEAIRDALWALVDAVLDGPE